jgi:hypothetical protein
MRLAVFTTSARINERRSHLVSARASKSFDKRQNQGIPLPEIEEFGNRYVVRGELKVFFAKKRQKSRFYRDFAV